MARSITARGLDWLQLPETCYYVAWQIARGDFWHSMNYRKFLCKKTITTANTRMGSSRNTGSCRVCTWCNRIVTVWINTVFNHHIVNFGDHWRRRGDILQISINFSELSQGKKSVETTKIITNYNFTPSELSLPLNPVSCRTRLFSWCVPTFKILDQQQRVQNNAKRHSKRVYCWRSCY